MNEQPAPNRILRLLFWETTIKCNLTCAHCRRIEDDHAVITDLTTRQGVKLIDQLAQVGKSQPMMPVLVFSGGEPLCRDDIFDLIAAELKALNVSERNQRLFLERAGLHGPKTLDQVAQELKISRERVRQLYEKIKERLLKRSRIKKLLQGME